MNQSANKENICPSNYKLSSRVIQGGIWVFLLRIFQRLFGLLRITILARILAPKDFGMMGIAMLTMSILETFSETGFQQTLIQKKGNINSYFDTAWTVLVLRGFVLFVILYFAAPYAAIFFGAVEAKPIIQVIGLSILLQAFTNIGVICFQKELEFNKQFFYQLSGVLADFIVAVAAVLILKSVWALVFGVIAGNIAKCLSSYLVHPYRPHLNIDLKKAKELFGFGKWVSVSSILTFLLIQSDAVFVGKFLGVESLGFYQLAYQISNLTTTEIAHVASIVTYPAYSKLQDDIARLRQAYLKVIQTIAFISLLIAGLIFTLSDGLVLVIFGEKWMPMVPVVSVLVWWGVIRCLVGSISPVFLSIGKFRTVAILQAIQVVLLLVLIYPLACRWGIFGVSLAVLISALLMFFIRSYILVKTIACKKMDYYKPILIPCIITAVDIAAVVYLKIYVFQTTSICILIFLALIFILILIFLVYMFEKFFDYKIWATVINNLAIRENFKINLKL